MWWGWCMWREQGLVCWGQDEGQVNVLGGAALFGGSRDRWWWGDLFLLLPSHPSQPSFLNSGPRSAKRRSWEDSPVPTLAPPGLNPYHRLVKTFNSLPSLPGTVKKS